MHLHLTPLPYTGLLKIVDFVIRNIFIYYFSSTTNPSTPPLTLENFLEVNNPNETPKYPLPPSRDEDVYLPSPLFKQTQENSVIEYRHGNQKIELALQQESYPNPEFKQPFNECMDIMQKVIAFNQQSSNKSSLYLNSKDIPDNTWLVGSHLFSSCARGYQGSKENTFSISQEHIQKLDFELNTSIIEGEVIENESGITFLLDLPGYNPKNVYAIIDERQLLIKATRQLQPDPTWQVVFNSRPSAQVLSLTSTHPNNILDPSSFKILKYENGILTATVQFKSSSS